MEPWGRSRRSLRSRSQRSERQLPEPIRFGDWVMKHREFALVRVRAASGVEGFAFTLTREGALAATIQRAIAHHYVGAAIAGRRQRQLFYRCQGSNLAALSSGIGLRALSIVDLAIHDLLARSLELPIARISVVSHGSCRPRRSSATRQRRCHPDAVKRAGPRAHARRLASLQDPDRAAARVRPRPAPSCTRGRRRRRVARNGRCVDLPLRRRRRRVSGRRPLPRGSGGSRTSFRRATPRSWRELQSALGRHPDRDGRRARRQLLPRGAAPARVGRRGPHRPHLHGGHHARAPDDRRLRSGRSRVLAAHVRARPLAGVRRRSATTSRSSGACPARASTSSPTRSRSRLLRKDGWMEPFMPEHGFGPLVQRVLAARPGRRRPRRPHCGARPRRLADATERLR